MIGKPQWFGRRKYTGWGFTPRTWQGWAYIGLIVVAFVAVQAAPVPPGAKLFLLVGLGLVFAVDTIDIMLHLASDERERVHEAIAERNALWAMIVVLIIGIAYQAAQTAAMGVSYVDPWILVALVVAVVAKAVTNVYLDRRD